MLVFITLLITKTVQQLSRLLGGGGGSALPGLVAERLDSQIVAKLIRSLPEGSIVVTGTNGKTTTTKMLAAILEASGVRVVTNKSGSNLSRGIASTLIDAASLRGVLPYDLALLEVDEASMPSVCALAQPKIIVVLNLFRDQLDRYGELDRTAQLIGTGIEATNAEVFLNADDPLVAGLTKYTKAGDKVSFFGVEKALSSRLQHDLAADSDHCPICGKALRYSANFFGHIGHYRCEEGHFDRPKPDYALTEIRADMEGEMIEIALPKGKARFNLRLPGLYNAYNALAAISVATSMNIGGGKVAAALATVGAAFGRVERVEIEGRIIYLLLIKNPTGLNQVIQTFFSSTVDIDLSGSPASDKRHAANVMLAINDNFADGRDVSWLWDAAIEELSTLQSGEKSEIIASGIRAYDMALRLKYAGLDSQVFEDLAAGLRALVKATPIGGTAYVLPTYTAMFSLRQLISKQASLAGFWK